MTDIKFPKKQAQRLIPKYLLEYATELNENHPDPSADWGASYTAGNGIDITGKVISNTYADVEANPTLAGNEDTLEGLEVDGVKYAVGAGKQLYQHNIWANISGGMGKMCLQIINDNSTVIAYNDLYSYLVGKGYTSEDTCIACNGCDINDNVIWGVYCNDNKFHFCYKHLGSTYSVAKTNMLSNYYKDTVIAL